VPGLQTFSEDAWQALAEYVEDGATLLMSGVITRDAHNLAIHPNLFEMTESDQIGERPVCRYEFLFLPAVNPYITHTNCICFAGIQRLRGDKLA
jgi:hypothetical protein